jgi:two-component system, LuxR family, response regulator FixJ
MSNPDVVVHIVDDEEVVRNSLAFLLGTSGFAIRVHESASAFIEVAPGIRNGCLITDLRMPDMDGVELLRRLRQMDAMLPAIVISGHGDVQMAVDAMKNGAFDFIEKPFSDDVLIAAIEHAVEQAELKIRDGAATQAILSRLASLSERETQVLKGVVEGLPNKAIAYELGLSSRTVEVYRAGLMGKMAAGSLSELVRMVLSVDWKPPS